MPANATTDASAAIVCHFRKIRIRVLPRSNCDIKTDHSHVGVWEEMLAGFLPVGKLNRSVCKSITNPYGRRDHALVGALRSGVVVGL